MQARFGLSPIYCEYESFKTILTHVFVMISTSKEGARVGEKCLARFDDRENRAKARTSPLHAAVLGQYRKFWERQGNIGKYRAIQGNSGKDREI